MSTFSFFHTRTVERAVRAAQFAQTEMSLSDSQLLVLTNNWLHLFFLEKGLATAKQPKLNTSTIRSLCAAIGNVTEGRFYASANDIVPGAGISIQRFSSIQTIDVNADAPKGSRVRAVKTNNTYGEKIARVLEV